MYSKGTYLKPSLVCFVCVLLIHMYTNLFFVNASIAPYTQSDLDVPLFSQKGLDWSAYPDPSVCSADGNSQCITQQHTSPTSLKRGLYEKDCGGHVGCWQHDSCLKHGDCCVNYLDQCKRPKIVRLTSHIGAYNVSIPTEHVYLVHVYGYNFGDEMKDTQNQQDLSINGEYIWKRNIQDKVKITHWSDQMITLEMSSPFPCMGEIQVNVVNYLGLRNDVTISSNRLHIAAPSVYSIYPNTVVPGQFMEVQGSSFSTHVKMTLEGQNIDLLSQSHTSITFLVPRDMACKTGLCELQIHACTGRSASVDIPYTLPSILQYNDIVVNSTMTLHGKYLEYTTVYLNHTQCMPITQNNTYIECIPPVLTSSPRVLMHVQQGKSTTKSNTMSVTFVPRILQITTMQEQLILHGRYFTNKQYTVYIDGLSVNQDIQSWNNTHIILQNMPYTRIHVNVHGLVSNVYYSKNTHSTPKASRMSTVQNQNYQVQHSPRYLPPTKANIVAQQPRTAAKKLSKKNNHITPIITGIQPMYIAPTDTVITVYGKYFQNTHVQINKDTECSILSAKYTDVMDQLVCSLNMIPSQAIQVQVAQNAELSSNTFHVHQKQVQTYSPKKHTMKSIPASILSTSTQTPQVVAKKTKKVTTPAERIHPVLPEQRTPEPSVQQKVHIMQQNVAKVSLEHPIITKVSYETNNRVVVTMTHWEEHTPEAVVVTVNDVICHFLSLSKETYICNMAQALVSQGNLVRVLSSMYYIKPYVFDLMQAPVVSRVTPQDIQHDTIITVQGQFFTGDTIINVFGTTCLPVTLTSSQIACRVLHMKTSMTTSPVHLQSLAYSVYSQDTVFCQQTSVKTVSPRTFPPYSNGNSVVTITGTKLSPEHIYLDNKLCLVTGQTEEVVTCQVPQMTDATEIVLIVKEYSTTLKYNVPEITNVSDIAPYEPIKLEGVNFHPHMKVYIGSELCVQKFDTVSDTSCTCTLHAAVASTKITVQSHGKEYTQKKVFPTLIAPKMQVHPRKLRLSGDKITILGFPFTQDVSVRMGPHALVCTSQYKHTICDVPVHKSGSSTLLTVRKNELRASLTVEYLQPRVFAVNPTVVSNNHNKLIVHGEAFPSDEVPIITLGEDLACIPIIYNEHSIECNVDPIETSETVRVKVCFKNTCVFASSTVQVAATPVQAILTTEPMVLAAVTAPVVTNIVSAQCSSVNITHIRNCPRNSDSTTTPTLVTITGTNFGVANLAIYVGGTAISGLTHTDTQAVFTLPKLYGQALTVLLIRQDGTYGNNARISFRSCVIGSYEDSTGRCALCSAGYYSNVPGLFACLPCEPGEFQTVTGATTCESCEAGTANRVYGHNEVCEPCVPGYYTAETRKIECSPCFPGMYTASYASTICTNCLPGSYASAIVAASACLDCAAGKYSYLSNSITCLECETGKYSVDARQSSCTACETGKVQALPGKTSCSACESGYYMDKLGQAMCLPCNEGSASSISLPYGTLANSPLRVIQCGKCNVGHFAQKPSPSNPFAAGAAACLPCGLGTYANDQEQQTCIACPRGRYADVTGLSECKPCNKGSFQDQTGQATCKACPEGQYADTTDSMQCKPCVRGKYNTIPGAETCISCNPGTFQNLEGQTTCVDCAAGKLSSSGAAVCLNCVAGKYSTSGQSVCTNCPKGTYSGNVFNTGVSICSECQPGSYAPLEGMAICQLCPYGTYSDQTRREICTNCPIHTYNRQHGQTVCSACAAGSEALEGAVICTPCPLGRYMDVTSLVCKQCSPGTYTNQLGLTGCTECEIGKYQAGTGETACHQCGLGMYEATTGNTVCDSCAPGTYQDMYGMTQCKQCLAGTYSDIDGQSSCLDCQKGSFNDIDAQSSCSACGMGKYTDTLASTVCLECEVGKYTSVLGTLRCTDCGAGTYQVNPGQTKCDECPLGTFQNFSGRSECIDCTPGTFGNSTKRAVCTECNRGEFQPNAASTACELCSIGMFNDLPGQSICQDCPVGTFSAVEGLYTCTLCFSGTSNNLTKQTICQDCDRGTFQSAMGQSSCQECSVGSFQRDTGKPQCHACPDGQFQDTPAQTFCSICDSGTYSVQDNGLGASICTDCEPGTINPLLGQSTCVPCDPGTYYDNVSNSCVDCPLGTYQDIPGQTVCTECAAGSFTNTLGNSACKACRPGTYQPTMGNSVCIDCAIGTFTATSGETVCTDCPVGYFSTNSGTVYCTPCTFGSYGTSTTSCALCDIGKHQDDMGQSVCKDCLEGTYSNLPGSIHCNLCPPGQYSNVTTSTICESCDIGMYADTHGLSVCMDCMAGKFTTTPGTIQCRSCTLGKYQPLQGQTVCEACAIGKHQENMGQSICQDCTPGTFAGDTGKVYCDGCSPGTYSDQPASTICTACVIGTSQELFGQTECLPCVEGYFQPNAQANTCLPCAAGKYTDTTGNAQCVECAIGSSNPHTGQSICAACEPGRYSPVINSVDCIACESGLHQPASGQSVCLDCPVGTKAVPSSLLVGASVCSLCEVGTYQSQTNQRECFPCVAGTVSDTEGSTTCALCTSGKHAPDYGLSVCLDCDVGTFSVDNGDHLVYCQACEEGAYTDVLGSTGCTTCLAGTYQPNQMSSSCNDCPAGTYQAQPGQGMCIPCSVGKYSNGIQATACTSCPIGTYAPTTGLAECYPCILGSYQPFEGQSMCLPCEPGYSTNQSGSTQCTACTEGYYQPIAGGQECLLCEPGSYTVTPAQPQCIQCQPGTYNALYGGTSCINCIPGKSQAFYGRSVCADCKVGTYTDGNASMQVCALCDAGKASDISGSVECVTCDPLISDPSSDGSMCLCKPGYYLPDYDVSLPTTHFDYTYISGQNKFKCVACPEGANCQNAGTRWSTMQAEYGWWRANSVAATFYRCLVQSHCPGGVASSTMFNDENGSQCSAGRDGVLCNVCAKGYRTYMDGACEPCPEHAGQWIVLLIFLVFVLFVVAVAYYALFRAADDELRVNLLTEIPQAIVEKEEMNATSQEVDEEHEELEEITDDTEHSVVEKEDDTPTLDNQGKKQQNTITRAPVNTVSIQDSIVLPKAPSPPPNFTYKLKIFVSFLQISTTSGRNLEIIWPNTYKRIIRVFDFANFSSFIGVITASDCYDLLDYYTRYVLTIVIPVLLLVVLSILWLIPQHYHVLCFRNLSNTQQLRWNVRGWIVVLFFLYIIFPAVSSTILNHYVCKEITDGSNTYQFLIVDLHVLCKTDLWYDYAYLGIFMTCFYPVGIFGFITYILVRNRNKLHIPTVRARFGFLYNSYNAEYYWWDLVDMMHKILITCIVPFLPFEMQLPGAMIVVGVYLIALLVVQPYTRKADDTLALLCQNLLLVIFSAGYLFKHNDDVIVSDLEDVGMSIVLILATLVFVFVFIGVTMQTFKQFLDGMIQKCKNKKTDEIPPPPVALVEVVDEEEELTEEISEDDAPNKHADDQQPQEQPTQETIHTDPEPVITMEE